MDTNFIRKNWKMLIIACVALGLSIWLIFGEHGLLYLKERRIVLKEYNEKVDELTQEKIKLEKEIIRLQSDKDYLEQVIREETGKVKKNEIKVFISEEGDEKK